MLQRPLILKLFALLLFIDPLLRIAFISIERDFSFLTVLNKTLHLGPMDFFNFWFLFPISGVLLLGVKVYSYLAFILIQFYSLYFHINYESFSWPYLSKTPSSTAYMLLVLNISMVMYLLLPRSREIFFDKSLRWWERGSRYTINEPCFVKVLDQEIHGKVVDLSHGGALIDLDHKVNTGDIVNLNFDILNSNVNLTAQVIREVKKGHHVYFGTQFMYQGLWQKIRLKFLMLSIAKTKDYSKYR